MSGSPPPFRRVKASLQRLSNCCMHSATVQFMDVSPSAMRPPVLTVVRIYSCYDFYERFLPGAHNQIKEVLDSKTVIKRRLNSSQCLKFDNSAHAAT